MIAKIQLESLADRLSEKDIAFEIDASALDELGKTGFDPVYGARPLKRQIQQVIENPIATALLSGRFGPGDTIQVGLNDNQEFEFS